MGFILLLLCGIPEVTHGAGRQSLEPLQVSLEGVRTLAKTQVEQAQKQLDSLATISFEVDQNLVQAHFHYTQGIIHKYLNQNEIAEAEFMRGLPLAQKYSDHQLTARILRELGAQRNRVGDNLETLRYYYAAIEMAGKVDDFRLIGACNSLIGNVFRVLGDYHKSIEFTLLALQNYQKAEFEEGYAWIAYTLGVIYLDLNLYDEALEQLNTSLNTYTKVAHESGDSLGIAICLDQIGQAHFEQDQLILARQSFDRANSIYAMGNNIRGLSISFKNLGKVEYKLGEYDRSIELLMQAYRINQNEGAIFGMATLYEFIGLSLFAKHEYQAAIDSVELGLEFAISTNQRPLENTCMAFWPICIMNGARLRRPLNILSDKTLCQIPFLISPPR